MGLGPFLGRVESITTLYGISYVIDDDLRVYRLQKDGESWIVSKVRDLENPKRMAFSVVPIKLSSADCNGWQ